MIGRIRHREIFSRLAKEGTYVRSQGLWCSLLTDSTLDCAHLGYAIGRRVGGAVERNRIKRRLRALLAIKSAHLQPGWYLIGASPAAATMSWTNLERLVDQLISQIDIRLAREGQQ